MSEAPGRFLMNGVEVDAVGLEGASDWILERAEQGTGAAVHTINAHAFSLARRDPSHAALLAAADLNIPDGMPVVWAARRLGFPLTERAYGPDVLERTVDLGRSQGITHLLYGGTEEAVTGAVDELRRRYPGARVEGLSPPYRDSHQAAAEEAVRLLAERDEQIVWVCLGAPRQDVVMGRVRPESKAVLVGVGAAVDFLAGTTKQAPPILQKAGLEWAYRLATEPRRLATRYAQGNWDLVRGVVEQRPRRLR